jgi:methylenetetrahydrofolate dehydrogenase (NADP+)/methenyltetrahydrofolate cyclohydrolase
MKIDGKALAGQIVNGLKEKVSHLQQKPALAVIQVGNDESSTAYINQKKKRAEQVGIAIDYKHFPETISELELLAEIQKLNSDNLINGIIIQRPLPPHIQINSITDAVSADKDVDGFRLDSPFTPPVALAVLHILSTILTEVSLRTKNIVIIGRGETAGKPIADAFEKRAISFIVIHTQTENCEDILKNADIIISCVGKGRVLQKSDLKHGVILIGVGIHREQTGKLMGDYDEDEIKNIASYYTPTPGGVGPLTVAFLLKNLVN